MQDLKLGAAISLYPPMLEAEFKRLRELDMQSFQLLSWDINARTPEMLEIVKKYMKEYKVEISALWCGWSPQAYWNFYEGQETLGLVPPAFREHRLAELTQGISFAKALGTKDLITHCGYMPENPHDPNYTGTISALKILCGKLKAEGMYFDFETGQETPVVLMRAIEDIGTENIGINLDPSNLITYGKANPVDALDMIGDFVRGLHIKDGFYPTSGKACGEEVRVGDGKVNFPAFIKGLNEHHYKGHFTIEREITGEQQTADIIHAMEVVKNEYYKYEW